MKYRNAAMNKSEMTRFSQLRGAYGLENHKEFILQPEFEYRGKRRGAIKVYASFVYEERGVKYAEFIPPLDPLLLKLFEYNYKEYEVR